MKILVSLSSTTDVSVECDRYIKFEVKRLLREYPIYMSRWLAPVAYTNRLTSEFDYFDKKLVFSSYFLAGTVDEANTLIDKANKPDFNVGSGLKALVHHEFGHAVNAFIVDNIGREGQDTWLGAKKELLATMPFPSTYSRKNSREHFAELYALESLSGAKGKLRKLIDKFIRLI